MFSKLEGSSEIGKKEKQNQKEAILINIMKVMNILGLLLTIFGLKYTLPVFDFLFKGKYTTTTCIQAMKLFIIYIYFCGINGITEAYVYGSLTEKQLAYFKRFVSVSTIAFLLGCYFMADYGASGLIIAQIFSMIIRITISF